MRLIHLFITIILLASAICSCRSVKYVPVESVRQDTVYVNRLQRDSVYVADSVFVREKGDTVQIVRTRYIDRFRNRTDTLRMVSNDTIRVPYPVERELTKWQEFRLKWFNILVAVLLGLIIWTFRKPIITFIRKLI